MVVCINWGQENQFRLLYVLKVHKGEGVNIKYKLIRKMFNGYLVSNLFRLKSLIYFDKLMAALESSYQKIKQTFYETLYFTSVMFKINDFSLFFAIKKLYFPMNLSIYFVNWMLREGVKKTF